jgi:hypothetical protein
VIYSLTAEDVDTGAVADTFTTMLALIAGATAGHRGRLLQLTVTPAGNAPADLNIACQVNKTDQTTAGTPGATTTSANIPRGDPAQRDSIMSGADEYSVEPTNYDTKASWAADFNLRGGLDHAWAPGEGPAWGPSETLGIRLAPRTAAAHAVTVAVLWEEN